MPNTSPPDPSPRPLFSYLTEEIEAQSQESIHGVSSHILPPTNIYTRTLSLLTYQPRFYPNQIPPLVCLKQPLSLIQRYCYSMSPLSHINFFLPLLDFSNHQKKRYFTHLCSPDSKTVCESCLCPLSPVTLLRLSCLPSFWHRSGQGH